MHIQDAIKLIISNTSLTAEQTASVMAQVMRGEATPAQIGALLVGLRMKGESTDEVIGTVRVMRSMLTPVQVEAEPLIDCCGTGGDGANLFNVSTASAFVIAASGAKVAKHGNRSVSSSTGSADVLEAAGVSLNLPPRLIAEGIQKIGLGFMFAPAHHSALKHAAGPRKELGVRTLFNMVGPLVNPAFVKRQVIGVFEPRLCRLMAEVLNALGSEHVMVVHAQDGLDEFSLAAPTQVCELKDGQIEEFKMTPEDVGLITQTLDGLSVKSAAESWELIREAFEMSTNPSAVKARDVIAFNAGAAIYVAGLAGDLREGVTKALALIESGAALEKAVALAEFSQQAAGEPF